MTIPAVKTLTRSGHLRAASPDPQLRRATARLAPPDVTAELFEGIGELPHPTPDPKAVSPAAIAARKRAIAPTARAHRATVAA